MRQAASLLLLTLTLAFSLSADERHQSYISYDDGGTVVRSGGERDVEAHRNLPIYPGDEVETARRGRAEVMLSDGNIIGIDRATAIAFRSILDAYEGDSNETVAELRFGKVAVHRTDIGRQHVRLDTAQASYVATYEAVYSVESDSRGRDRVTVFAGSVEVRTPQRTTRLRRGEAATVDDEGVYDLVGNQLAAADDFERWFLKRSERFGSYDNKYVDRRLSYWSDDLDTHGRWVFLTGIGWSWRPYVAVGWRPYYNGYWHHSRWGAMTWVSHDPWGWAPYHYGRWAHDPGFGWVWVPGYSYSPAWVYWMYGPTYVGWAPAGWWDCNPRYYDWAYRPYRRAGYDIGFGFHGRIRVGDIDYRPWTFVDSNTIFTSRIDRAALKTDVIKNRLSRGGDDGFATVSGGPARFTREEVRNPAEAIRRRGLGGDGGGSVTGANTDLTPFIRRDPNLGTGVRDRIVGSRGNTNTLVNGQPTRSAGGLAPISGGSVAPIGRGSLAPVGGGSVAPIGGSGSGATVDRRGNDLGTSAPAQRDPVRTIGRDREDRGTAVGRDRDGSSGSGSSSGAASSWRDRVNNRGVEQPSTSEPATTTPDRSATPRDTWRNRRGSDAGSSAPSTRDSSSSSDVPSRVIDGIGGARTVPRDNDDSSSTRSSAGTRWDRGSRGSSGSSGSSDSGSSTSTRSRESSGSSRSTERAAPAPRVERPSRSSDGGSNSGSRSSGSSSGGSSTRSNDGDGSKSGGGNRESGGRIKRDN